MSWQLEMELIGILSLLGLFIAITFALQITSVFLVLLRLRRIDRPNVPLTLPGVSILRPLCGIENNLEETLASTFLLDYPNYEIIFCVALPSDAAIAVVERLMARHPNIDAKLVIGDDRICVNPKLNNLKKGWEAARYDWVVMVDSNVLLPHNYVQCFFSHWVDDTGLVSSPAIGIRPKGIWAEVECAFLNTFQARWQLAGDQLGLGYAQGKNMFWRRDVLDKAGGIKAMAAEIAEDVASTKIVRNAGLKVRLVRNPFPQPLGYRSFRVVWNRQSRWARLRRVGLKTLFLPELALGGLFPLLAALLFVLLGGFSLLWVLAFFVAWYGLETVLAKAAGWPISPKAVLAMVLRDVLLPGIWLSAWSNGSFVWHGTVMTTRQDAQTVFSADA